MHFPWAIQRLRSYKGSEAVTKSDSTTYTPPLAALYVGTGGDVKIRTYTRDGSTLGDVIYPNVPTGGRITVPIFKVYATDTDASDFVGEW